MEQLCGKGQNDHGDWNSLVSNVCQTWAQTRCKDDDTQWNACGCSNYKEYAKIFELLAEKQKKLTIHLPRKIVAHMSTAPYTTLLVEGQDAWFPKGQFMRDVPPHHITDPAQKNLWFNIGSMDMSSVDLVQSFTLRGLNLPRITRVEPQGPHSDYELAYLNSFPSQTLDENTQRWCPSESGGITATSFRVHFEEGVRVKDIHLEVIGLVVKDFDKIMKKVKRSGLLLITSEGLQMNGPQ